MPNEFLIFDENGTNVLAQELYDLDPERFDGVQRGRARSDLFNKSMRQVTFMANAIGQIVHDYGGSARENSALKSEILSALKLVTKEYIESSLKGDCVIDNTTTSFSNGRIITEFESGGNSITEFSGNQIITKYYDENNELTQTDTVTFNSNGSISTTYDKV